VGEEVFLPPSLAENAVFGSSKFLKGQGKLFSKSFPCYRGFFQKPPLAVLLTEIFSQGQSRKEKAAPHEAGPRRPAVCGTWLWDFVGEELCLSLSLPKTQFSAVQSF
jgi:hypothetical protein